MNQHPLMNQRFPDETYDEYCERRKRMNRKLKARLRGMLFYASNDVEPGATSRSGRVPYRKPVEVADEAQEAQKVAG